MSTPLDTAPLNAKEAAAWLNVSRSTFYAWIRTGELAAITHTSPTGRRFWLKEELTMWLRSRCFATDTEAGVA